MLVTALGVFLAGCTATEEGPVTAEAVSISETQEAAGVFADIERRLLAGPSIHLVAVIQSTGAVTSDLEVRGTIDATNMATLQASGSLSGRPAKLAFSSDGVLMRGNDGHGGFQLESPPRLSEGLILGFTRMGLLHNLARLSAGQPPESTDGRIREQVQTARHAWAGSRTLPGGQVNLAIGFDIVWDGQVVGEATLWIDERTGLPVERTQTVHFGEADMHVTARYEELDLRPAN